MMEHSAENQKHRTMNFCSLVLVLIAVTLGWGTAGAQAQSVHGSYLDNGQLVKNTLVVPIGTLLKNFSSSVAKLSTRSRLPG